MIGGENYLDWVAAVGYPYYDETNNVQYFPYKTLSMLVGLFCMILVSFITDRLMKSGRMDRKWLRYINNRASMAHNATAVSQKNIAEDSQIDLSMSDLDKSQQHTD